MTLSLASLTLGTATLGNLFEAVGEGQAQAVLEAAWNCGIRSFDTAPHYGLGLSETRLGRFLRGMPMQDVKVSTKVGRLLRPNPGGPKRDPELFDVPGTLTRVWDFSDSGVRASLGESLDRMGLDRVHTLYLHDPEKAPNPDEARNTGLPALAVLRDERLVSRIGVGSMDEQALFAAAEHAGTDELMVAGRHTLIDHTAAARLLPACRASGVTVAATAVYNSGLLATVRPSGRFDYAQASPEMLARADRLADICIAHGTDLPTAALHYAALDPAVTSVVFGARTPAQVRENVERATATPEPALWEALQAEGLVPAVVA
ncbi:aldo/keto reductase [Terrabacter sp. 28]|nr:aldo/keto reductase [Terrabacter sp. 28]